MEVKDILKSRRQELNLTMKEVATSVGVNEGTISRWESGKTEPTLENAKYLSMYFDVSVDYLIGLTYTKTPSRLLALRKDAKGES